MSSPPLSQLKDVEGSHFLEVPSKPQESTLDRLSNKILHSFPHIHYFINEKRSVLYKIEDITSAYPVEMGPIMTKWKRLNERLTLIFLRQLKFIHQYFLHHDLFYLNFLNQCTGLSLKTRASILKKIYKLKMIFSQEAHEILTPQITKIENLFYDYACLIAKTVHTLEKTTSDSKLYIKTFYEQQGYLEIGGGMVGGFIGSSFGMIGMGAGLLGGTTLVSYTKNKIQKFVNNGRFKGREFTPTTNQYVRGYYQNWSTGLWGKVLLKSSKTAGHIFIDISQTETLMVSFNLQKDPLITPFDILDLFETLDYKRVKEDLNHAQYVQIVQELDLVEISPHPELKKGFLLDFANGLRDSIKEALFEIRPKP